MQLFSADATLFVKDNPTKADEGQIKIIDYIDKKLAKGDITVWGKFKEERSLPLLDE